MWLTGSRKRETLFSWSCLLFSNETEYTSWITSDIKDHIASVCKIKIIANVLNSAQRDVVI